VMFLKTGPRLTTNFVWLRLISSALCHKPSVVIECEMSSA
jgi:hypothetical protein